MAKTIAARRRVHAGIAKCESRNSVLFSLNDEFFVGRPFKEKFQANPNQIPRVVALNHMITISGVVTASVTYLALYAARLCDKNPQKSLALSIIIRVA